MCDPDPSRESYERRYSAYANMGFELRDSSCSPSSSEDALGGDAYEGKEKRLRELISSYHLICAKGARYSTE